MASIFRPSRREKWSPFATAEAVLLAADDLDSLEGTQESFKREMRAEMKWIKGLLFGVCCSTTGMAIIGAINYVALTHGGK